MSDDLQWGYNEEYEVAYAMLLANLSPNRLPRPTFWSLEQNAQKVRIALRALTGLRLDDWDAMTPPERIPWLEAANEAKVNPKGDRPVGVVSQADAAILLSLESIQVSRLIGKGLDSIPGSNGRVWITLESLEEYRRQRKRR